MVLKKSVFEENLGQNAQYFASISYYAILLFDFYKDFILLRYKICKNRYR